MISVVTVCYNCEKDIERTLISLASQSYKDYEHIVVDGASKDNTVAVAKSYSDRIINMSVFSEPDKGIYDAMNKGVLKAKGDYVFFLNAGDTFCSDDVLQKVSEYLKTNKDIYYGDIIINGAYVKHPEKLTKTYLVLREKMICHQAIFAKRNCLENNPFDLGFRICADRDWLIKCVNEKSQIQYIKGLAICDYDMNGVSSQRSAVINDSLRIAKKYGKTPAVIFVKFKRMCGKIIRKFK